MELRDYLRIVRKGWVLIAVMALVSVAAAAAYSFLRTPEYSASSKVFVSVQGGDTVNDLVQGSTFTQNRVKSYAELVTTPAVLRPVIEDLGLDEDAATVAKRVQATAPLDTSIIQIDATSPEPTASADLANAVSQSLAAVVQKIEAPQGGNGPSPVRLTQVTEALVPEAPVSPNVPVNLALGALIGLALGLGAAVLRETLDTRIRGEHDLRGISGAPVVGGIAVDPAAPQRPLIVHDDPRSVRAEAFRTLRTNFQFLGGTDRRRSFIVTSSVEGEGKTTTVANLAIALAEAGRRVVVIDADLRRPRLAEVLGLEGAVGLSDLLIGAAELDDVLQPWGRGQLHVLPAGRIPPNPSELLGSSAMVDLIERLEERYEYVLFDAAPLLPVTDSAVLSEYVSGVLVVVASGRTRKAQLRGTMAALAHVDVVPAGIVLTMLPRKVRDAYEYGYGYAAESSAIASDEPAIESLIPRPAERRVSERRSPSPSIARSAEQLRAQETASSATPHAAHQNDGNPPTEGDQRGDAVHRREEGAPDEGGQYEGLVPSAPPGEDR